MVQFDVAGAQKAGYSEAQIADAISKKAGFDAAGARNAGYADADIISRLTSAPAPGGPQVDVQPEPPALTPLQQEHKKLAGEYGVGESILIGAGRTFDRIGKGMQQLYHGATGNDAALAKLKERAEGDNAGYEALQAARPIATGVGESLPSMVVPIGGTATVAATAAKLAASAAIPSALEYGTVEERAKKAAISAGGAVVGGVVVPKLAGAAVNAGKAALKGMVGNITPEALALAARAKQLGIPVNAAQLGDSKFLKTLASSLEQMPLTGGAKSAAAQRSALTNAVSKTFGEDVKKVTPEIYAAAKERLGKQFDDLAARNSLRITPNFVNRLSGVIRDAAATANDDTIRAMNNLAGRISNQAQGARLPGKMYSSLDTELSNIIKAGGEKGLYAKRMQSILREGMDSSISAADQAAWTQTRTQYKNLKAVRTIVGKDMGGGDIPPSQLMNALNATDAGKEAMAMGSRGVLGDIGQIGKQFVRDAVPNSGTAQRMMAMGLIGGGGYAAGMDPTTIAGMMAGGATAGRLMNKVIWSPKTIEALGTRGLTLAEMARLNPSKVQQIVGGTAGMTAAKQKERK